MQEKWISMRNSIAVTNAAEHLAKSRVLKAVDLKGIDMIQ